MRNLIWFRIDIYPQILNRFQINILLNVFLECKIPSIEYPMDFRCKYCGNKYKREMRHLLSNLWTNVMSLSNTWQSYRCVRHRKWYWLFEWRNKKLKDKQQWSKLTCGDGSNRIVIHRLSNSEDVPTLIRSVRFEQWVLN